MVDFDKDTYWKKRNHITVTRNEKGEITSALPAPMRGQTDTLIKPTIAKWTQEDFEKGKCIKDKIGQERTSGIKYVMFGGVPMPMSRPRRRQRTINRKFTQKGYHYGIKVGSKEYNLIHHIAKRQTT